MIANYNVACNVPPDLSPASNSSRTVLPSTGSYSDVASALPFGIYANSSDFITGAVDQVAFTFAMLGGRTLDIELNACDVYAAYERAVLEYSYIVNLYQAKNSLSSFLGSTTGSFNSDGQILSGSSLSGSNAALKFPRFSISYARRIGDEIGYEAGIGGTVPFYSASINIIDGVQDYNLQSIISSSAASGTVAYADAINGSNNAKIRVNKVWYKTPHANWRFFGFYGGVSTVGNLHTYGQYADDSTFEIVPVWQNKLQALAFEDAMYTRVSHYSYELKNNQLRLYPVPSSGILTKVWFEFSLDPNPLDEPVDNDGNVLGGSIGINGVNNLNNLPFENIPYASINSMGKQWIRRFALAIAKEILSQVRGKIASGIPIPGDTIQLNADTLSSQAKEEMDALREELKQQLEETTYDKLVEKEADMVQNAAKTQSFIPKRIYVI